MYNKVPQWKAISNLNSRLYHLSVSVTDVFLVPCYVFYNATAKHGWKWEMLSPRSSHIFQLKHT